MIIGIIHPGSGLGDSLFSYIATRVRAADLGVDFGFVGKEFFKGYDFNAASTIPLITDLSIDACEI